MTDLNSDDVFFETDTHGRVCLGGGSFEYALICTRLGGFEVWDTIEPRMGRCIAGEGYAGRSRIEIGSLVVFESEDCVPERERSTS